LILLKLAKRRDKGVIHSTSIFPDIYAKSTSKIKARIIIIHDEKM